MAKDILISTPERGARGGPNMTVPAGRVLVMAGLLYLFGSLVDLATLWIGQGQASLEFEFVALSRTTEAYPRLIVSAALIYAGLSMGGSRRLLWYRLLAIWFLALGIGAAAILGLVGLNYASLSGNVTDQARGVFNASVVKTVALSLLYMLFLMPTGVLGLRLKETRS